MKLLIDSKMADFLTVADDEEALDQPLYHFQTYAVGGATQYTFFNTATGSATNGFSDTNMDTASQLSIGKRAAVFGISLVFLPGANPAVAQATTANFIPNNQWNDINAIFNGIGNAQFTLLEKSYGVWAPLSYLPAGIGVFGMGGGVVNNQTTAANNSFIAAGATNGFPAPMVSRRLKVPLPIPSQMRFNFFLNFNTAIAIQTAGRIGVILDCLQIRAKQ